MSIAPAALALVVASSLGWSCLDALRKRLVRQVSPPVVLLALAAGSLPLFALWWGLSGFPNGAALASWDYWPAALGSILGNVAGNLALLAALRRAPISATVPMLSLTPVFVTLFSIPLLGEIPGPRQAVGALLVVAGALVLHPPVRARLGGPGPGPGVALAALTALLWSVALPLDKRAIAQAGGPLHALVLNAGVAVAVLALLARKRAFAAAGGVGGAAWPLAGALAVASLALGLQYLALAQVPAGFLETVKRGVGNGMAVVWGSGLFGETITPRVGIAAALMAAGVGALLL